MSDISTLLNLSYDYNRNNSVGTLNGKTGHLTKIVDNLNSNKNREYEFDVLGRLAKAKGGPTGNLSQQNYTYDRFGNRTGVSATGVAADNTTMPADGIPTLAFEAASNRITTSGFQYDSAGNQIKSLGENGEGLRFEYDAANRVQVIKKDSDGSYVQAFQYGSSNARLMDFDYSYGYLKIFAATGEATLAEYTEFTGAVPTWTKSYAYLGDRLLSTITPNGSSGEFTEYDHPDRLGTKTITSQATGTSCEQAHLPFGRPLDAESTLTTNNKRFTSYDRSARTGLDYAMNRTYDSKQGRFTQVDPIGIKASNLEVPQTLNLYAYCANDPVNHVDPNGLGFFSWLGKIFSSIGRWINRILSNIVVQIAILILSAIVTLGTSLVATLSIFMASYAMPTWLTVARWVLTGVGVASSIGSALELGGLLLQGKFRELGKIIALAFVGALAGIVEDSIINGVWNSLKNGGNLFSGAWTGFKKGLSYVWDVLKRFGSKKWWEGFVPVYGFFCGPGFGSDSLPGRNGEVGVDGRDKACKAHDEGLAERDKLIEAKLPHKTTTSYDLSLIWRVLISTSRPRFVDIAFGSGGRVGDRYGFTVPFAFGIRIAANGGR